LLLIFDYFENERYYLVGLACKQWHKLAKSITERIESFSLDSIISYYAASANMHILKWFK
jgi:hypothetical protein